MLVKEVIAVLESVLNLKDRAGQLTAETALLGHVPELDSMAVVAVLTKIEERFGFIVEDGGGDVAHGSHVRVIVEREPFLAKAERRR